MASDRAAIRKSAKQASDSEPELNQALLDGQAAQARLAAANAKYQHAHKMRLADLGWFGRVIGGSGNGPINIAGAVVLIGFAGTGICFYVAYKTGARDFWVDAAHYCGSAAASALGFIFGRTGNKESE